MEKHHPSFIQQGKNIAGAVSRVASVLVSGGRVLVSDAEFYYRFNLCLSNVCDNCDVLAERCFICGCYLKPKLSLTTEKCPLGYWLEINES